MTSKPLFSKAKSKGILDKIDIAVEAVPPRDSWEKEAFGAKHCGLNHAGRPCGKEVVGRAIGGAGSVEVYFCEDKQHRIRAIKEARRMVETQIRKEAGVSKSENEFGEIPHRGKR